MTTPETKNPKTVLELYSELALLIAKGYGNHLWEAWEGELEIVDKKSNAVAIFHEP